MKKCLIACVLSAYVGGTVEGFSGIDRRIIAAYSLGSSTTSRRATPQNAESGTPLEEEDANPSKTSRRAFFFQAGIMSATTLVAGNSILPSPAVAAAAAAPPPSANVFADKNFSADDAKKRFQDARKDLKYLLDNYSDISKNGGGDAVRNYLGTQGVNSHLYGIQKVLKILTEEAEDIVEYSEAMEEFNAYYYQAEGAAYQSMFAEHSSAKVSPESCLATAQQDIVQMAKYMDQLAVQLNL